MNQTLYGPKIGREVLLIRANSENHRNSEGDLIVLRDGTIMLAYTKYSGNHAKDGYMADEDEAEIYAVFSHDDGETWGEGRTLLKKYDDELNIMSVTLRRMQDGAIGMFHLRKHPNGDCIMHLSRSYDEGLTWSEPVRCIEEHGYYVSNNDRVIRLKNGDLIFPASLHTHENYTNFNGNGLIRFFISHDDGKTWRRTAGEFRIPFDTPTDGLQEPGILELNDGRLWCWSRCAFGFQFEAFSPDHGETWSNVRPNRYFSSPCSPMCVKRIQGNKVLAVFNPIPFHNGRRFIPEIASRSPLVCAVSDDGAEGFGKPMLLEGDPTWDFNYTAILPHKDYILLSYFCVDGCWKNHEPYCELADLKVRKVKLSELGL